MTASKFAPRASTTAAKAPRAKRAAQREPETVHAAHDMPAFVDAEILGITPRRQLVANISWLVSFATSYYWSMQITNYLAVAALAYSGSAFIAFLVAFIGAVIAFIGAWKLAKRVFAAVIDFDFGLAQQLVDDRAAKVRTWFAKGDDAALRSDR